MGGVEGAAREGGRMLLLLLLLVLLVMRLLLLPVAGRTVLRIVCVGVRGRRGRMFARTHTVGRSAKRRGEA